MDIRQELNKTSNIQSVGMDDPPKSISFRFFYGLDLNMTGILESVATRRKTVVHMTQALAWTDPASKIQELVPLPDSPVWRSYVFSN